MNRRDLFIEVLRGHLGRPYIWGGDNPMTGFDCSGLIVEGLRSAGTLERDEDATADSMLRVRFKDRRRLDKAEFLPGVLLFWGTGDKATHVEAVYVVIALDPYTIGASGGGSKTVSEAEAVKSDAYVKIRPARSGWIAALDPFATW